MAATIFITCFKRRQNRAGDTFITSFQNEKSEWDLLKEDATLQSMNCNFEVLLYDDLRLLSNGYAKKVNQPLYVDIRFGEDYDHSVKYNGQYLATHIAGFVIQLVKKNAPKSIEAPLPVETTIAERAAETVATPTSTSDSFTSSWKLPITIVSGAILLSILVGGVIFFDWRRRKGSALHNLTPFFLSNVPDKAQPVDFNKLRKEHKEEEFEAEL